MAAVPKILQRVLAATAAKIGIILATDGGANDGKAVEVTGTSDGAVNINLASGSLDVQVTNDGTFAKETGGNLAAMAATLAAGVGAPTTASSPTSLADQTATAGAVALGSLARGPGGLMISGNLGNPAGSIVRVSGSDVATNKGQQLGPGGSYTNTSVQNASQLYIIIEAGIAPKICVSQA